MKNIQSINLPLPLCEYDKNKINKFNYVTIDIAYKFHCEMKICLRVQ